jgi:hypothetical protein
MLAFAKVCGRVVVEVQSISACGMETNIWLKVVIAAP